MRMFRYRTSMLLICVFLGPFLTANPAEAQVAAHLWWEEDLVNYVAAERNAYGTNPSYVNWAGVNGWTEYANRSLCTSFLTLVLQQAYGWTTRDFRAWFGSTSPTSARYHDIIVAENGFDRIMNVGDIAAGDVIAIRYLTESSTTGHVATARGGATPRAATTPVIANSFQYEVPVVDSSSSGHGPYDTRWLPDGTWRDGAGMGVMRIYADAQGEIVGYTWSTYSTSVFYDPSTRHLVVGRLQ
jgi:hypothetical protein